MGRNYDTQLHQVIRTLLYQLKLNIDELKKKHDEVVYPSKPYYLGKLEGFKDALFHVEKAVKALDIDDEMLYTSDD